MKKETLVNRKVEEALESLDGMQRASANPFLFTRIQQLLKERNSPWEKVASFLARPAFAVMVVAVFVSVNIWAATKRNEVNMAKSQQVSEQMLASEYSSPNFNLMPEQNTDR